MLLSRFVTVIQTMSDTSSLVMDMQRIKESLELGEENTQKEEKVDVIKTCNEIEDKMKYEKPKANKNANTNHPNHEVKHGKKVKVLRKKQSKKPGPKTKPEPTARNHSSGESDDSGQVILLRPSPPSFLPGMSMEW